MNIDFKLSVYRMIRNYICLRLIRIISKHYQEWEKAYETRFKREEEPTLPGSIIPFDSAINAITALNLRGGNSDIPLILAIYKIIHIIKQYMIKLVPKAFIKYISAYKALKDKYPKIKYIEDILVLSLSIATASIAVRSNTNKYILSYDVMNDNSQLDFTVVAERLGVNINICEFNKSLMFQVLMSRDMCDREKVLAFSYWLDEFINSSNTGGKQGLLLCLIAILVFLFLNNYGLFLELLYVLKKAVEDGRISNSMFKVIIRRLIKAGVRIPVLHGQDYN